MTKWWHLSWKRVVIALLAVFAVFWLIGETMEWLAPWREARSMLRDNPCLGVTPTPMPDRSVAPLSGSQLVLFGISLQTPWNGMGTISLEPGDAEVPFPEQHIAIRLFEPGSDWFLNKMWRLTERGQAGKTIVSSYNLMAAEMTVTPDQVKWWRRPNQNEATSFLLELKSMNLDGLGTIYTIDSGELHGFQLGNPAIAPYRVRLDLYDAADQHYQFRIDPKDRNRPILTQAEINAMVASIKPIPAH